MSSIPFRWVVATIILIMLLACQCTAVVASSAISFGAGYWNLVHYADGANEYLTYLNDSCEKVPPARKGRSHYKPRDVASREE